jgi:hypothetical protein
VTLSGTRSRTALLAACIVVAVASAGCETTDYSPIATMQAMPESHITPYPGAVLLDSGSAPRRSSLEEGTTGAYMDRDFGVNATTNANATFRAVAAYYDTQLAPLGWTGGGPWYKGGWEFDVEERPKSDWPTADQGYALIYEEVLSQNTSTSAASGSPNS